MLSSTRPLGGSNSNSIRDRTAEFQAVVERLQKQQGVATSSGLSNDSSGLGGPSTSAGTPQSQFAKRASKIGLGIHSTSQKLQKLAQLAKQTSMFDDPAQQINELSTVVKQDIQALNQAISDLQTFSGGGANRQSADHSHTVIDALRTRLKDATQEFRQVLSLRTDSLKVHQERKAMFTAAPDAGGPRGQPPFFAQQQQPGASFLPANARSFNRIRGGMQGGGDASQENGGSSEHAPLLQQSAAQQQQMVVAQQDTYLNSRAEALHQVESTIVELGSIFQQLAHMVAEQGEMAQRIDENVEDTLANVDAGQGQLLKYLNTISSNRWLMLKVFSVLMAFMLFFIMFIA